MLKITGAYKNTITLDIPDEIILDKKRTIIIRTPNEIDENRKPPSFKIKNFERGRIDVALNPDSTFEAGELRQITLEVRHVAIGSTVKIGDKTSINEAKFWCYRGGITIGEDCMMSEGIHFYSHDQHAIVDIATNDVINKNKHGVTLDDHVWVGRGAVLMPGVHIESGSILGAHSILTKDIPRNSIAAGNPTKVVRSNATWSRKLATAGPDYWEFVSQQ